MPLFAPESLNAVLAELESTEPPLVEYEIAHRLGELWKTADALPDEERKTVWAEMAVFNFIEPVASDKSVWGTHFAPVFETKRNDGTPFYAPDLKAVDTEIIEYWQCRASETQNPIFKARYADLVWDLSKAAIGAKPDVRYAGSAVDAYLESVELKRYKDGVHGVRCAERALSIALSIGDQVRVGRAIAALFLLAETEGRPRPTYLFDALFENKKILLTQDQVQRLIGILESHLSRCVVRSAGEGFDPWTGQEIAKRLCRYYQKQGRSGDVQRATRAWGEAFEHIAEQADAVLALAWLKPVYEAYRVHGMKPEADRVLLSIKNKGGQMAGQVPQHSVAVEISSEQVREFLEAITADGLEAALRRIALEFIPRLASVRQSLEVTAREFPFQAMIGVSKIADDQIVAEAGSVDEDPEGRLFMALAQHIDFQSPFLELAIDETIKQYTPKAQILTDFLFEAPLFDADRKDLVLDGLSAFLAGDHVKAVHVLVPQVENALRRLLLLLGQPPNKAMRSTKGVLQEKTLNDLLVESEIRRVLGEDCLTYLTVFLADPRGQNLRNRVCHGLASPERFARPWSDRVVHILLVLGLVRPVSPASGQSADQMPAGDATESRGNDSESGRVLL
jgi:hypothetical protein